MVDVNAARSFVVDAGPGLEPAVMLVPGVLVLQNDERLKWPGPEIVRVRQVSGAVWWKPWTWFDVSFEVEGLGRNA